MKNILKIREKFIQVFSKKENMSKRGSELTQNILVTTVMVVVIMTIFMPQMKSLVTTALSKITTYFNNALGEI